MRPRERPLRTDGETLTKGDNSFGPRRRHRSAMFDHRGFERRQPLRIGGRVVGQQPGPGAHRGIVTRRFAGMAGVERQHQPIEKAPPRRRCIGKYPVHCRGQPDQRQPITKRCRCGCGAVDADNPAFGRRCRCAGADLHLAAIGQQRRRNAPAPRAAAARRIRQRRAAQPPSWPEQRDCVENIGFSGAIVAGNDHSTRRRDDRRSGIRTKIG
jgi:hypothetical protein